MLAHLEVPPQYNLNLPGLSSASVFVPALTHDCAEHFPAGQLSLSVPEQPPRISDAWASVIGVPISGDDMALLKKPTRAATATPDIINFFILFLPFVCFYWFLVDPPGHYLPDGNCEQHAIP
jgi:hypothetical protein